MHKLPGSHSQPILLKYHVIVAKAVPIAHHVGVVNATAEQGLLVCGGVEAETITHVNFLLQLRLLHVICGKGESIEVMGDGRVRKGIHLGGSVEWAIEVAVSFSPTGYRVSQQNAVVPC